MGEVNCKFYGRKLHFWLHLHVCVAVKQNFQHLNWHFTSSNVNFECSYLLNNRMANSVDHDEIARL